MSPGQAAAAEASKARTVQTALGVAGGMVDQQIEFEREAEKREDRLFISRKETRDKARLDEWEVDPRWDKDTQEDGRSTPEVMAEEYQKVRAEILSEDGIRNPNTREAYTGQLGENLKVIDVAAQKKINDRRVDILNKGWDEDIRSRIDQNDFSGARQSLEEGKEASQFFSDNERKYLDAIEKEENRFNVDEAVKDYFVNGNSPDLDDIDLNAKANDKIRNIKSDASAELKDRAASTVAAMDVAIDRAADLNSIRALDEELDQAYARGDFGLGSAAATAYAGRKSRAQSRRETLERAAKSESDSKAGMPVSQKRIDEAFAEFLGTNPTQEEYEFQVVSMAQNGFTPGQVKQDLKAFIGSENGDTQAALIDRLRNEAPFAYSKLDRDVRAVGASYTNQRRAGNEPNIAMERATAHLKFTDDEKASRNSEYARTYRPYNQNTMRLEADVEDEAQKSAISWSYDNLVRTYWNNGNSIGEAREQANIDLNTMYGPTEINGEESMTVHPIESWVSEDFHDRYRTFVNDKVRAGLAGIHEGDFRIQSDWQTERTGDYLVYKKSTVDDVDRWDLIPDGQGGWLAYAPEGDLDEFNEVVTEEREQEALRRADISRMIDQARMQRFLDEDGR